MLFTTCALPIQKPPSSFSLEKVEFQWNDRFFSEEFQWNFYRSPKLSLVHNYIAKDFKNQWYFIYEKRVENLTELKYIRQYATSYKSTEDTQRPLVQWLRFSGLTPLEDDFNNAYSFTIQYTPSIENLSFKNQYRLANGENDEDAFRLFPLHMIREIQDSKETRFVVGVESRSFCVVTESTEYLQNMHIPTTSHLYLLTFVLHNRYDVISSKHTMPKLLCNLFSSVQSQNTLYNPTLIETIQFEKAVVMK